MCLLHGQAGSYVKESSDVIILGVTGTFGHHSFGKSSLLWKVSRSN
ncbi:rCG19993, isoform CRA_b [Rattus norvegicus]|uniref:RCG19993, isoform CRA_b n=1 Tax=Rattus norvegicus TaxID=10116 RepID=A6KIF2_RAT|nr:rCG19993, isoform CRA_b [Rattus norvegicus]